MDHLLYPFDLSFSREDETLKMKVFATPLEKVWGSNNVKVVKRRKMVKELVEAGWNKKEIIERCGATDTTIRKDIRILKEIGTIKDKQEIS